MNLILLLTVFQCSIFSSAQTTWYFKYVFCVKNDFYFNDICLRKLISCYQLVLFYDSKTYNDDFIDWIRMGRAISTHNTEKNCIQKFFFFGKKEAKTPGVLEKYIQVYS